MSMDVYAVVILLGWPIVSPFASSSGLPAFLAFDSDIIFAKFVPINVLICDCWRV